MPTIRPVSDLRNNFSQISQLVHGEEEPVFLTKNGTGDMVVMSIEYYEKQLAKLEVYQKLDEAERQIENGAKGKEYKLVLQKLRTTLDATR